MMKKKLLWLVPLTIIGSLLLVACGSDDEEVAAPAAPAPQGKSEPVAGGVATAVVPKTAPVVAATARPAPKQDKSAPGAAMYQAGSSIADILAGPAIGDIESE